MATEFRVELSVVLEPRINETLPQVTISVPGQARHTVLHHKQQFDFVFVASQGWLCIDFGNKIYTESTASADMAVIVSSVAFFGITDPRFVWAGVYTPHYPEPWFSEQNPPPPRTMTQQTYLGWNGQWRLDFSVPVFTWIHRTLNLGWLYN